MATVILHISRDPSLLLAHAAGGFLQPMAAGAPFPSPAYYLVLRQGGLRDDLLSLAASRGIPGWFDPPIALIQELPALLAEFQRPPAGDFERVVLIGRALRESAGPAFSRIRNLDAYADSVDHWIGELMGEGIGPADLAAALEWTGLPDAFTRDRDAALLATYTRYLELLDDAVLRDARARLIDCAAAIDARPQTIPDRLGGRRELRLVGLTDHRGGWPRLLRALRACPSLDRLAVYAASRIPFIEEVADDIVDLDRAPHFTTRLFTNGAMDSPDAPAATRTTETIEATGAIEATETERPIMELVSMPDLPREVEEIAVRVRRLIDGGVAPHRVAVVSRSARPYADHIIRALGRVGVPASARLRHALPEVPAIRALLALFRVAAEGWERLGLVELAETPYFRAQLDAGVLNHIGYRRRVRGLGEWQDAIARLYEAALARAARLEANPDDEDARRTPLPPQWRIMKARDDFARFTALASSLDESRTIAAWIAWLAAFIDADDWQLQHTMYSAPASRLDAVRVDVVAWHAVREIIEEWAGAEQRWGGGIVMDVRAFQARLRAMLTGDAALFTPARRGVQVIEGLAAPFRRFDHVFMIGLDAARVPMRMPHSPLLDEHERAALREAGLGIDTRQQWEEREQALFTNMLATAATSLTLSYARYDETGAEQLPSAFLEEVKDAFGLADAEVPGSRAFTPAVPLAVDANALEHAARAAAAERARGEAAVSPWNGSIQYESVQEWLAVELGAAKIWSPTQIEAYAKCPWAYFSARLLRLEKLVDPDLDIDPLTRGSILHDALRGFYDDARKRTGAPVHLREADLDWARPLVERAIEGAIDRARESVWVGHAALEAQKLEELKRQLVAYIEWEAGENEKGATRPRTNAAKWVRTDVDEHEVRFDDVALDTDGVRIRFRGFIDRVEVGNDPRGGSAHLVAAVDYKSSIWSTPASGKRAGWDDGVVLQVPLYAWALTQIRPGSRVARVEYRSIRKPGRAHTLPLYKYQEQRLVEDEKAREQYETALRNVAQKVRDSRAGKFPPDPPRSCNCPPFCHARDICRIPGGPRGGW